jgi:cytochrome c556
MAALFIAGGLLLGVDAAATEDNATIVKQRQDLMKQNGDDMKTIAGFVQGGAGTLDDVAAAAGQLAENAMKIPDLFPPNTGMNDVTEPKNGAKPVIWEKWDEFVGDADTLEQEALVMRELAMNGDADCVAAQLEVLGGEGCGGCHQTFRQKLE